MRAASLIFLFASRALAFAPHAGLDARGRALQAFLQGETTNAEAAYAALAPQSAKDKQAWLALNFEAQRYGAVATALSRSVEASDVFLRARAEADLGDWNGALESLGVPTLPAAQFLRAEALDAEGSSLAAGAWEALLGLGKEYPFMALAYFRAAQFSERQGNSEEAETRYRMAETLDPAQGGIDTRLAELYAEAGKTPQALRRLEKVLRVHPDDALSRDCLNVLLKENPALRAAAKLGETKRMQERLSGRNPVVEPLPFRPGETFLRIGILEKAAAFKFRLGSDTRLDPQGLTLSAGSIWQLKAERGLWRLRQEGLSPSARSIDLPSGSFQLLPFDPKTSLVLFDVNFGSGYFWAGEEDRSFRGNFEIRCDSVAGLTLIDLLPLEDYLLGVLPAEMPSRWPKEALLAQAIVARTNTLMMLGRHRSEGFDLCSDVHCQMYRGTGEEDPISHWAVTATAGEVLERGSKLVDCLYMNSSGGHTQDAWEAWDAWGVQAGPDDAVFDGESSSPWRQRFPLDPALLLDYLDDPLGDVRPWSLKLVGSAYSEYRWVLSYSSDELEDWINRKHPIGKLLGVTVLERSRFGFVKRLALHGSLGDYLAVSDYVRSAVPGLRSNLFYVETRSGQDGLPLEFLFHGGGWGHGVGFSQAGAAGQASAGRSHEAILKSYFPGSYVTRRY